MSKLQCNGYVLYVDGKRVSYAYCNVTCGVVPVCDVKCLNTVNAKKYEIKLNDETIFTGIGTGQSNSTMSILKLTSNSMCWSGMIVKPMAWQQVPPRIIIEDMCAPLEVELDLSRAPNHILERFSVGSIGVFSAMSMLSTTLSYYDIMCEYYFNAQGQLVYREVGTDEENPIAIEKEYIIRRGASYVEVLPMPVVHNSRIQLEGKILTASSVEHAVSIGNEQICRIHFEETGTIEHSMRSNRTSGNTEERINAQSTQEDIMLQKQYNILVNSKMVGEVLQESKVLSPEVKKVLDWTMVKRIYEAEKKRMKINDYSPSVPKGIPRVIIFTVAGVMAGGIIGGAIGLIANEVLPDPNPTVGRGQMEQSSMDVVKAKFQDDIQKYLQLLIDEGYIQVGERIRTDKINSINHWITFLNKNQKFIEDFFVMAYLAWQIQGSWEGSNERTQEDIVKYGIGGYKGIDWKGIQVIAGLRTDRDSELQDVHFSAIEPYMKSHRADDLAYINEVYGE